MKTRWGITDKMLLYKLEKFCTNANYLRYVLYNDAYIQQALWILYDMPGTVLGTRATAGTNTALFIP